MVGSGDLVSDFIASCGKRFRIKVISYLADFSGSLGYFSVKNSNFERADSSDFGDFLSDSNNVYFSQIVFFHSIDRKPQLGIYCISDYKNKDDLISEISQNIGEFSYDKTILFDEKKCQYSKRDKTEFSYCKDCAEICPTMAISSDDENRLLVFSQIDCILCGKCVSVCPSGAMQKSNATIKNLNKALKLYKDKIVFICENIDDFDKFMADFAESQDFIKGDSKNSAINANDSSDFANSNNATLSSDFANCDDSSDSSGDSKDLAKDLAIFNDIFPLVLPSINMLNYGYLLSILQASGRVCIICGEIDNILKDNLCFINDIYQRILGQVAILTSDCIEMNFLKRSLPYYTYEASEGEFIREEFANRIRFLIKDKDFGVVKNTLSVIYTDLKIDASKCTLCNACVESCNANALINAKDNFSLLLNPSLCTACGYCIDTCAEKCLDMQLDGFMLNEAFLNYRVLAKDEPFYCVECGEIFATNKSIQKVKNILQNAFLGDAIKLKSIECCEKCKIKIMFSQSVDSNSTKIATNTAIKGVE